MERDGQTISNRRRAYARIKQVDLIRGRVLGHKDGFGFVVPAEGGDDIYLHNRQMRKVFDGDEVLVRLSGDSYRGKDEAAIVEVLAHNTHQLVGRYCIENGIHYVRPDNAKLGHDVHISQGDGGKAQRGQFVVVEITQQPSKRTLPAGRIIEVLGDHMAPGMEIDVAIRAHGIPSLWPSDVSAEASELAAEVTEKDKKHRVDLRNTPFVTIDGEDARDFDDAVYCEPKRSGGWRLFVAIADVSHYVTLGSALDREAIERGTSVYFPDFVVPMLPEALSNGLCSLNPHVDRLCMVCEMTISASGKLTGYKFYEGLMHSHARLTYTKVGKMLGVKTGQAKGDERKEGQTLRKEYQDVVPHVDTLHDLYGALRAARTERGAIDFDTVETRILFDEDRKIDRIVPVQRNDAHKLIEECMLSANVCAAKFLDKHELPGLYRVHEGPGEEKLNNLREFFGELGLSMPGTKKPTPQDYQHMLQSIAGRPDAHLIQTVMLRSLSQAKYQPDNEGHFGLGYQAYAHFTSPIRRYPDLLVHRALRHVVRSNIETKHVTRVESARNIAKKRIYPYEIADMLQFGEGSSLRERRADEATRDVVSWLKCEYLQDHVGDQFEGIVSGVTGFGLFVELKDIYVDGLVHISSLPRDFYHFEKAQHRLVGEKTAQVFRLGDQLTVQVVRVDLDNRKIDFELIEAKGSSRRKAKAPSRDEGDAGKRKPKKSKSRKPAKKGDVEKVGKKKPATKRKPKAGSKPGLKPGSKPKSDSKPTAKKKAVSKGKKVRQAKSAKANKK
jgi:ribonuclease R